MNQAMGAAIDASGRVAIVLDDGIATGSTMIAALRAVRAPPPANSLPPPAWPPRRLASHPSGGR